MKRHLDYALAVIKAIIKLISVDLNFIKLDPLCLETGRRAPFKQYELSTNLERCSFCVPSQRTATASSPPKPNTWIANLLPATSGSTALDIPIIDNLLLMPAMGIYKIHTGIKGPIPKGNVGLLLGCSSLTRRRQWHPTPVLLPGKSHEWRTWWAAVHGVAKSQT